MSTKYAAVHRITAIIILLKIFPVIYETVDSSCFITSRSISFDTSSLSSLNVVASYRDGGFDKLCPKELEEKKAKLEEELAKQKEAIENKLKELEQGSDSNE